MGDQKNLILAIVISGAILLGWNFFYIAPQEAARKTREAEIAAQQEEQQTALPGQPGQPGSGAPILGAELPGMAPQGDVPAGESRESVLGSAARVTIESPRLRGSISLTGARLDDLTLSDYRETIEPDSPNIVLLEPVGTELPYYVQLGWLTQDNKFLGHDVEWRADKRTLGPDSPVTLTWDNGEGLVFEREISLDENYMFSIEQRVRNKGNTSVTLRSYGLVSRTGTPETLGFYLLHEGLLGVLGGTLEEVDYDDLVELEEDGAGGNINYTTTGGWLGITDKYRLVALIPDRETSLAASFKIDTTGPIEKFQADFLAPPMEIPPGGSVATTTRIFAGAKIVSLLDDYQEEFSIDLFDRAVDFGWFYWLTKPIFYALDWFFSVLGNFGLAIMALTVCIKLLFFPLANKSYRAMSKMKLLQPKMVEMREKYGDDRMRLNKEMMALYKREKVNPASGCLPILLQIPVFFALYKVLFVTIEMRQAPFYGWIADLSAPDPLGVLTMFGLISWDVPESLVFINIGIWPILMGLTMFFQQKLNPPPPDPMQAKLFMMLPLVFTFILAGFPAGLVIYWTWNNLLTICQQWVIMRSVKRAQEKPPVDFDPGPPEPEPDPESDSETDSTPPQVSMPRPKKKKRRKRR